LCQKFCIDFTDQSNNSPTSWLWLFPGGIPSSSTNQNPVNICYDNPGSYDVTLITTNAFGTDTFTSINYITVFPTPPFPVITQTGNTLTSSFADFYQWQFNSIDIPGATSQSYTATQTGFYTVVVSDANGCVNSTTTYVEITGIEELNSSFDFAVYPNPSNGNFIVEWLSGQVNGAVTIEIFNALGQVIFSKDALPSMATGLHFTEEIVLNQISPGAYFIKLTHENAFVRKVIMITN